MKPIPGVLPVTLCDASPQQTNSITVPNIGMNGN